MHLPRTVHALRFDHACLTVSQHLDLALQLSHTLAVIDATTTFPCVYRRRRIGVMTVDRQ